MKVGIAYPAFFTSFKKAFPDLVVFKPKEHKITDFNLMIFSGGEDINPKIYGEHNRYSSINEDRDNIEKEVFSLALNNSVKILGVCRGHQLINAILGGRLVQDIQFELNEKHPSYHKLEWTNELVGGKSLIEDMKSTNSLHHQAVTRPGNGLTIMAKVNRVIEITAGRNILTVQFHPEWMGEDSGPHKEFFDYVKEWVSEKQEDASPKSVSTRLKKMPSIPTLESWWTTPQELSTPQNSGYLATTSTSTNTASPSEPAEEPISNLTSLEAYLRRMEEERRSR